MGDKPGESAELIQAKAARGANMIALIGVLVTAVGTVGGLAITVWMARQDKEGEAGPAVDERTQADAGVAASAPKEAASATSSERPKKTPTAPVAKKVVAATTAAPAAVTPADLALDLGDGVKLELVLVKPGTFMMGSPDGEDGRSMDEGPRHEVNMTKPFLIGKYEVTQAQYEKVTGGNPSKAKGDNLPVENVTWEEADAFCAMLSRKIRPRKARLPTEAEWEYACRAGTNTPTAFGKFLTSEDANFDGNRPYGSAPKGEYRASTLPVGSLPANDWGIHDMHGNVKEWTDDWYTAGTYRRKSNENPKGPPSGSAKAIRGGSWREPGSLCRSAERAMRSHKLKSEDIGFRVVVEVQQ